MAQFLHIHPENPQPRLLQRAADLVRDGAVIAYPTDSTYALGCHLGDKTAADRLRAIRRFDRHHLFTLVCRDLSEIARYARVDNQQYRLLKAATPGPTTFILRATKQAPRRLLHEKRKTIGLRVPEAPIAQALLALLDEPLLSCTLTLPPDETPVSEPGEVHDALDRLVDVVIDGGPCGPEPTTIVDWSGPAPELLREGLGARQWRQWLDALPGG